MKLFLTLTCLFVSCFSCTDAEQSNAGISDSTAFRERSKDMSDPTNTLSGKKEALELRYIVFGCACANWLPLNEAGKYEGDDLSKRTIFIEPARADLELPLYFDPGRHFIKVTGEFYVKKDYPKGTEETEQRLQKARVFRYFSLDVRKIPFDHSPADDTTLILNYNAISCPCAQWSVEDPGFDSTREYYYLEPANEKLIKADTLFDGANLPVQVEVTGQIVSYSGYPTGYNPVKGNPDPSIVFQYRKIKVLKRGASRK